MLVRSAFKRVLFIGSGFTCVFIVCSVHELTELYPFHVGNSIPEPHTIVILRR